MIKAALTLLAVASAGASLGAARDVPAGAVATVDGQAITRQAFDHWITVAAKANGSRVPDPEDGYRRCIADGRKVQPKASHDRLARQCRRDYEQLRNQVLQ